MQQTNKNKGHANYSTGGAGMEGHRTSSSRYITINRAKPLLASLQFNRSLGELGHEVSTEAVPTTRSADATDEHNSDSECR